MAIINGSSIYGKVILTDPSGASDPAELVLPPYNESGLVESYIIPQVRDELIGLDIEAPSIRQVQDILGFRIRFTCHYDRFITGDDLYNTIKRVLDAANANWYIDFYPRYNIIARFYRVLLGNETLELGLNKGGARAKYHRLPVLVFETVDLIQDLGWLPPEITPVYQPGGGTGLPIEGGM